MSGDLVWRASRDVATPETNAARIGPDETGDHIDQRGFALSIGTDNPEVAGSRDGEAEVVEGPHATEALLYVVHLEDVVDGIVPHTSTHRSTW